MKKLDAVTSILFFFILLSQLILGYLVYQNSQMISLLNQKVVEGTEFRFEQLNRGLGVFDKRNGLSIFCNVESSNSILEITEFFMIDYLNYTFEIIDNKQ